MSTDSATRKRTFSKIDATVEHSTSAGLPKSSLCVKCSALQLDKVLSKTPFPTADDDNQKPTKIASVGQYYRQISTGDCPLCQILSRSRLHIDQHEQEQQSFSDDDELLICRFIKHLRLIDHGYGNKAEVARLFQQQTSVYLIVAPSGYAEGKVKVTDGLSSNGERNGFAVVQHSGFPRPDVFAARPVGSIFEPYLAKTWWNYCKSHHKKVCSVSSKSTTELRLIDCYSRTVKSISGKAPPYVALSYVWGSSAEPAEQQVQNTNDGVPLPSSLPATMSDSMSLTRDLGLQFLWIDQFCIDQHDKVAKHGQIVQMGSIYENADLTIIAAAGQDPSYGLVGVGKHRTRDTQQTAQLGDFEVISTLRDPHIAIQCSRWSTRAWTFQEAVLSRRRLVFTDDQVYYECNAMNCLESLTSNLDRLHAKDKSKFRSVLRAGHFGRNHTQKYGQFDQEAMSKGRNFRRYLTMVERYTARNMKYDSDSLDAFIGIIRRFSIGKNSVSNIWGVPIQFGDSSTDLEASFVHGLIWKHTNATSEGQPAPSRRPDFPSWSWAGWSGEVEYYGGGISSTSHPQHPHNKVQTISLEFEDGLVLNLPEFFRSITDIPLEPNSPRLIRLVAPSLNDSAFSFDKTRSFRIFGYKTEVFLSTGSCDALEFYQSVVGARTRRCVYIAYQVPHCVLVVLDSHNDVWVRVGLLRIDCMSYQLEEKLFLSQEGSTPESKSVGLFEKIRRIRREEFHIS